MTKMEKVVETANAIKPESHTLEERDFLFANMYGPVLWAPPEVKKEVIKEAEKPQDFGLQNYDSWDDWATGLLLVEKRIESQVSGQNTAPKAPVAA